MVSVAGRGAPRGSVAVWITQVPGRLLSPARRPLVPGLEGQSLRQERGGCAWAERPGAGDAGGASGRAVQQLLRPLLHALRCGGRGQDLTPILMASAVSAAERNQETMAEASRGKGTVRSGLIPAGPGRCPRPRRPSRAGFPAGGRPAPVPASFVPCASPPRLIRTQVTRDQGPPLFTHGIRRALFLNKFPSRGHQGQGQGQHSL